MTWRLVALVVFTEAQHVPATCMHVKRDKMDQESLQELKGLAFVTFKVFFRDGIGMILPNVDMEV